jgi:predicted MFS family arabinose efflux permease
MSEHIKSIPAQAELSVRNLIALALVTRLLVDTSIQIFSPFLPVIAMGLGVEAATVGMLVSVRSLAGLTAPVFGSLADRLSYRLVLRVGLLMGALGSILVGLSPGLWTAVLGVIFLGVGLSTFIPMLQAYLSARLPYERRAQGLGIVEYSYALGGIIGLFVAGQLMAVFSWRVPFVIMGVGMLIAWVAFSRLPATRSASIRDLAALLLKGGIPWSARLRDLVDLGAAGRSAWGTVLVASMNSFAAAHLTIAHGVWLNREYGLGPAQLGTVALFLGLVDLMSTGLVSMIADRLGKRRSVFLGTAGSAIGYSLLPLFNVDLMPALIGFAIVRFFIGYTIVSNIPLLSEQVPTQRGKVMTLAMASGMIGISLAGLTGPWAYDQFGVWGLGSASAAAMVVSLLAIVRVVREGGGG